MLSTPRARRRSPAPPWGFVKGWKRSFTSWGRQRTAAWASWRSCAPTWRRSPPTSRPAAAGRRRHPMCLRSSRSWSPRGWRSPCGEAPVWPGRARRRTRPATRSYSRARMAGLTDDRRSRRGRKELVWGLALALLTPSVWLMTRAPDAVGVLPAVQPHLPAVGHVPRPYRVTEVEPHSARLGDLRFGASPRPVRVRIGAIGVVAPIVPVGADPVTGIVRVPDSVHRVGWYRFGPTPGEPGSAVLVG